jgi:formylglycine-generating enzyme required for sulfatase activity
MKKNLVTILIFELFFCNLFSQEELNIKNFAKLNDSVYIYKYEVSNKLYSDFLKSNEFDKSKIKIDTAQWLKKEHYSMVYASYYHNQPAYKNFPVVNISYDAAKLFCLWLKKQYNNNRKKTFKRVEFRLPTEKEWEFAAKGGNPNAIFGWKETDEKNIKTNKSGNYYSAKNNELNALKNTIIENVSSFQPNGYGIYNMSGNVSEMVEEKSYVKGGDWFHDLEYCKINSKLAWDSNPQPYIGFRFVMVVKEK